MQIREIRARLAAVVVLIGLPATGQLYAQEIESTASRVLKLSESDQVAWIETYLQDGAVEPTEALAILAMSKSSLVLPLLEKEIESILHTTNPRELFKNPAADPQTIVNLAYGTIQYAGNEQALREASKLMKIDPIRFGDMVYRTLLHAGARRNPFIVAYQGFEIGDPSVDERIIGWAEMIFGLKGQADHLEKRKWWAEAMVEKYDGVPTGDQWTHDPIVSHLDPNKHAGLHDEMLPLTVQAAQKRLKK